MSGLQSKKLRTCDILYVIVRYFQWNNNVKICSITHRFYKVITCFSDFPRVLLLHNKYFWADTLQNTFYFLSLWSISFEMLVLSWTRKKSTWNVVAATYQYTIACECETANIAFYWIQSWLYKIFYWNERRKMIIYYFNFMAY